jgi:hypothetical protein
MIYNQACVYPDTSSAEPTDLEKQENCICGGCQSEKETFNFSKLFEEKYEESQLFEGASRRAGLHSVDG